MKIMETIETAIEDYNNVHVVQNNFEEFNQHLTEFQAAYEAWCGLLSHEELIPVIDWHDKHWYMMTECKYKIINWIATAKERIEERLDVKSSSSRSFLASSCRSYSSRHSSISDKAREAAKVAELKAKAALLERKQALENETEKFRLHEELVIAQSREKAYTQFENEVKREATNDWMNIWRNFTRYIKKL